MRFNATSSQLHISEWYIVYQLEYAGAGEYICNVQRNAPFHHCSSMISSFQPTFTIEDHNSNSILWPHCFITKFIYPNYHMLKSLTILKNHSLGSLQWLRWEITVVLHNPLLDVQLHLITQGGPTRTQPLYRPTVGEIYFHFLYVRWQNFLFSTKWYHNVDEHWF